MEIRLQKFLADAGIASRRQSEKYIRDGRVSVNGSLVTAVGSKVDTNRDTVTFDGKSVVLEQKYIYLMLHKPEGVVTSVRDPQNRRVVMDLIKDVETRVFPVGRLDYDTSGLLLMTNDGGLAYKLTHPRHEVNKTYTARLRGIPSKASLRAFREGLLIDGVRTAPAQIEIQKATRGSGEAFCTVQIIIHEGRNRQIRKMCEAIGHPVMQLKRVAVGKIYLGGLPRGAYRFLTDAEVKYLKDNL